MNKQVTEEKDKKMKTIGRKLIQSGTTGKRFVKRKTKERQKESDISKTLVYAILTEERMRCCCCFFIPISFSLYPPTHK